MEILIVTVLPIVGYFLPTIIAAMRSKQNTLAIGTLNLLLGWTIVGWVVALVWSFTHDSYDGRLKKEMPSLEQSFNSKRKVVAALVIVGGFVFMYYTQSERTDRPQTVEQEQPPVSGDAREL